MSQLERIDAIERRFRSAVETLHANSSYASNEYFPPVTGLAAEPAPVPRISA